MCSHTKMTSLSYPSPPTQFIPISANIPTTAEVQVVQFGVEIPNRVFVGGCPYNMTEKELGDFFSQFGPVKDCKIVFDKATGKSLGYGFVTYICEADAINVYCKGSIYYKEKKLNVSKAVRKQGGQFIRPNQEFVNGSMFMHPSNCYMSPENLWGSYQVPSHAQPVKPYYTVFVGPNVQQPGLAYGVQSPTLAPMGTGYMPQVYQPLPPHSPNVNQRMVVQEITSESQPVPHKTVVQASVLEANICSEQDTSLDSEKESPENTFQPLIVSDSAYSSDEHCLSNESDQVGSTEEALKGVDLDRLFERRHSPTSLRCKQPHECRKNNLFQSQQDQYFVPPPPPTGLLPAPLGYPMGRHPPV